MRKRDVKYCVDLDAHEIFLLPVLVTVVMAVIYTGAMLFAACSKDAEEVAAYNQQVEAFNDLPRAEREVMKPLIEKWDSDFLDDKLLGKMQDEPFDMLAFLKRNMPLCALLVIAVFFVLVVVRYDSAKMKYYYFYDLPLGTAYGWFLLIMLIPVGWPFLLVSYLRARWATRSNKYTQAEKEAVRALALVELAAESNTQQVTIKGSAKKTFIQFRVQHFEDAQKLRVKRLRAKVNSQKDEIAKLGKKIAELQRQLGESKAELKEAEAVIPSREATKREAELEWQQILKMRGVAELEVPKKRKRDEQCLRILVKVRVPYKDVLYDFGDYMVTFFANGFKCQQVRSGVRENAESRRPIYPDSEYGFCFGNRLYDIRDYVRHGQIVDALTLIIDCFHSVNDGDKIYIPKCYRQVKTVEQAKKRLKLLSIFQRR